MWLYWADIWIICVRYSDPQSGSDREYWMIYRGPGCLEVVWLTPSPPPSSRSPVSKLSLFLKLPVSCRSSLLTAGEGEEGGGEEPNHTTAKSLVLYNSFSTLLAQASSISSHPYMDEYMYEYLQREGERGDGKEQVHVYQVYLTSLAGERVDGDDIDRSCR